MAVQLGIQVGSLLAEYAASRWRSRRPVEIRDHYGYRAFSEPFVQFRLSLGFTLCAGRVQTDQVPCSIARRPG